MNRILFTILFHLFSASFMCIASCVSLRTDSYLNEYINNMWIFA